MLVRGLGLNGLIYLYYKFHHSMHTIHCRFHIFKTHVSITIILVYKYDQFTKLVYTGTNVVYNIIIKYRGVGVISSSLSPLKFHPWIN